MFNSTPNRRRRVLFGVVAACLSASVIGGSWAAVTAQTTQEGNSIDYTALLTPVFVDGSGLINANVSPGQEPQSFEVVMRNDGNLIGQPSYWVHGLSADDFSDAVLDNTRVVVKVPGAIGQYHLDLRDFIENAFIATNPDHFISDGKEWSLGFEFIPSDDASDWTADDLGEFAQNFPSTLHLTTASKSTSDLAEYAKVNGTELFGGVFMIPVADVEKGAAGQITQEVSE